MWFMDEKLFTVTPPVNLQNDRVYVAVPMRKKQLAANRLLRTCSNFSKSIMVSVRVSSLGCTELIFIDPGVKINSAYNRDVYSVSTYCLLLKNCRAVNFSYSNSTVLQLNKSEKLWICFQEKLHILFHPLFGLPNSPDLNLVDYKIWSLL